MLSVTELTDAGELASSTVVTMRRSPLVTPLGSVHVMEVMDGGDDVALLTLEETRVGGSCWRGPAD